MGDYDKLITPKFNRVKHGHAPDALAYRKNPAEHVPATDTIQRLNVPTPSHKDFDSPKIADRDERQAVQKLPAHDSNNPISLSAIGIGLLSLVTLFGVRMH